MPLLVPFYKVWRLKSRLLLENVMKITFCRIANNLCGRVFSATRSPGENHQADDLPANIRRENQKPGDHIADANLPAERVVKIVVADTAVIPEHGFSDGINNKQHYNQAKKQESDEQGYLFGRTLSEGGGVCCGVHSNFPENLRLREPLSLPTSVLRSRQLWI